MNVFIDRLWGVSITEMLKFIDVKVHSDV